MAKKISFLVLAIVHQVNLNENEKYIYIFVFHFFLLQEKTFFFSIIFVFVNYSL